MTSATRSVRLPFSRVLTYQLAHLHTKSSLCRHGAAGSKLVPLIGLEIHAQLNSRTKLFSRAPYRFGAPPNSQLALLDMAIPGSMPVLNRRCVEAAVLIALALNCQINRVSRFDRKHYFYADSPSGYQITQQSQPIANSGYLDYLWTGPSEEESHLTDIPLTQSIMSQTGKSYALSRARIKRVQLEQDTGKSLHDSQHERSLIDFNRAGVGLVELVTEPDFIHANQTAAFVDELVCILSALGVCGANASLGELRVDVNVSVGPSLTEQGPRTEVKNVNSVRGVARAIDFEVDRQISLLLSGAEPINETRAFDPVQGITLPMRDKEVIQDYRYFPEPNIPPLRLLSTCDRCHHATTGDITTNPSNDSGTRPSPYDRICIRCMQIEYARILALRGTGELPNATRKRLLIEHALGQDKVSVLVNNQALLNLYEECLTRFTNNRIKPADADISTVRRELGFWVCGPLFSIFQDSGSARLPSPETLVKFVELNLTGEIHGSGATQLLSLLTDPGSRAKVSDRSPRDLAQSHGLILIHDPEQMRDACEQLVRDNPKLVSAYNAGKEKKALKRLATLLLTTNATKYRSEKFNPFVAERLIKSIIQNTSSA